MHIQPFAVEQWMNAHETSARWNIAETCVDSLRLDELLALAGDGHVLPALLATRLDYGDITGSVPLRTAIAGLYGPSITPDQVLVTNGAIGANHLLHQTLVERGDTVICVKPTYQQLYSVPNALGAQVRTLDLRSRNGYLPDLDELESLVDERTSLIVLNNPNNPTGSLMSEGMLTDIVTIARARDAVIHCDEVYRGLEHEPGTQAPSIADLYERGVSTGSLSKTYSLAGLRTGWIAGPHEIVARCLEWRDYTTISCGVLDDALAAAALGSGAVLDRALTIVRRNIEIVDEWLSSEPHLSHLRPRAGTTTLIRYEYPIDSEAFCSALFACNGAFVVPGSAFDEEASFRLGYACAADVLQGGLAAVSQFLRTLEA